MPAPRNPHTRTGKVDLVGSVHLALSVDTVGRKARSDLLYQQARSLYDAALTESIAEVGCTGPGHLSGGAELSALKKRAEWSAASIAKTYNKDLLTMVEAAEADWVEAHGSKKGMTRLWLAKTVQPAIRERDAWKETQIGVTEQTWVNDKARQDFFGRNQVEGEMRVVPGIAVCDICQALVNRGWMKMSEAVQIQFPIHPSCPHHLLAKPLKESVPDCASLWRGQVKTGRKSESVEALIQALELNYFHEPAGSPIGGRFAKSNTSTLVSPSKFTETRDDNIPAEFRAFVTAYSPKEYREMGVRTYVSKGGKSGYAIKKDGDIISVFSSEGKGKMMIVDAIKRGGNKLDCFDGFLPSFYGKFGFKETGRFKWDDQYKPQGWDTAKHDNPDVVLMELSK